VSQSIKSTRAVDYVSQSRRASRRRPRSGWYDQYCEGVPVDMNHFLDCISS